MNRQIIKSSETIMYFVDILDNMLGTFMGPRNDQGTTDDRPRQYVDGWNGIGGMLGQLVTFAQSLYQLTR